MPLTVTADCQHFVPSIEQATVTYIVPPGKKILRMALTITDRDDVEVYRAGWDSNHPRLQPPPGNCKVNWDGSFNRFPVVNNAITNQPVTQFAHPIRSPYTVKLIARLAPATPLTSPPLGVSTQPSSSIVPCRLRSALPPKPHVIPVEEDSEVQEATCAVAVLYRDITVETMPWEDVYQACTEKADANFPTGGSNAEKTMWLQFKLNAIGFHAGPLDSNDTLPLMRALFQYTQNSPSGLLPKVYAFATLTAGAPGTGLWGWKTAWENIYGTVAAIIANTGPQPGKDLLTKLKADDASRNDVVRTAGWLTRQATAMAVVDHDQYYLNGDYSKPDAHADYDKELFNPPIVPLRAKILLLAKADATAASPGVDAPLAVGPAEIEWTAFDPSDELRAPEGNLPNLPAEFRPKAKLYLTEMMKSRAANAGHALDPRDNCPTDLGGVRTSPADMNAHFLSLENLTAPVIIGTKFFGVAHSAPDHPRNEFGAAPVYFQSSYIAGDNFVVQARLSLDNVAGGAVKPLHTNLAGLANSFGPLACLPQSQELPALKQSGKLTVWRRHRILREISWAPQPYPATDWGSIQPTFANAYILLIPPAEPPIPIEQLFPQSALKRLVAKLAADGQAYFTNNHANHEASSEFAARHANPVFDPTGMYPIPLPTLAEVEVATNADTTRAPDLRFDAYFTYLQNIFRDWPKYDPLVGFYQALRTEYDKLGRGQGLLVLRSRFGTTPNWSTVLPQPVLKATSKKQAAFKYPYRTLSTGGDFGIVALDESAIEKFTDFALVTHEIGHCLFTTHPWEFPGDHDKTDFNCIMYYGDKNEGIYIGWGLRDKKGFGVRVQVEGRKTDNSLKTVPSFGKFDGGLEPEILESGPSKKRFYCRGTPTEIAKKLSSLKFTPERNLDPEVATIEIKVLFDDSGRWVPKLSVGWVNKRAHVVIVRPDNGSVKPFEGLTATALADAVPTFCGKCLLKLRGWRVREDDAHNGAANIIDQPRAIPVLPKMEFVGYKIKEGIFANHQDQHIDAKDGAVDPLAPNIPIGPLAFLHVHKLRWESSDGNLASLTGIITREEVRFDHPTQAPPFCDFADADQYFTQAGTGGELGNSNDDHSVMIPSMICAFPRQVGKIVAQQWYQYSFDGINYQNIEGAAYLLEKEVSQDSKGRWILTFRKKNWVPYNPVPYSFEASYYIGPPPVTQPKIQVNTQKGTMLAPFISPAATRYLSGDRESFTYSSSEKAVELAYLKKKGYHV